MAIYALRRTVYRRNDIIDPRPPAREISQADDLWLATKRDESRASRRDRIVR